MGERQPGRVEVQRQHAHAGECEKLRRQLPDEANAHHGTPPAKLRFRKPHRMQRYRAQGGVAGGFVWYPGRHRRGEVAGHQIHGGMVGHAPASDGHLLAALELAFQPIAHGKDHAACRVAEGQRFIQPRAHRVGGSGDAVAPQLRQRLAHQIRARPGFAPKAALGETHRQPFGAGGYQRGARVYQQMARP